MMAALHAARTAVAEARDTRREAADLAMVAMHDPEAGSDAATEAAEVWRRADADLAGAEGQLSLAKAAAGLTPVVSLDNVRPALADLQSKTVTVTTIHRSVS